MYCLHGGVTILNCSVANGKRAGPFRPEGDRRGTSKMRSIHKTVFLLRYDSYSGEVSEFLFQVLCHNQSNHRVEDLRKILFISWKYPD